MIIDKNFSPLMERVFFGKSFSQEETQALVHSMMDGTLSDLRIASVLTAFQFLNASSEVIGAIIGALDKKYPISLNSDHFQNLVDCGGTGGRHTFSLNISILASLVAASAGAVVAKFSGQRALNKSENGNILNLLDIPLANTVEQATEYLGKTGIAFLYATSFYPRLKDLNDIRKTLGFRTIMDVVFPLANPFQLTGQVVGVYHKDLMPLMIHCLKKLGRKRALVVHAESGFDEISVCAATYISQLDSGKITHHVWKPGDFGFQTHSYEDMKPAHVDLTTEVIFDILENKIHPAIIHALEWNAAAILWCAEKCNSIQEGVFMARHAIESGKAVKHLKKMCELG